MASTRTETDPMNLAYYQVHLGHVASSSVNGKANPNFSSLWLYSGKIVSKMWFEIKKLKSEKWIEI